jgi:hypothetical protein
VDNPESSAGYPQPLGEGLGLSAYSFPQPENLVFTGISV